MLNPETPAPATPEAFPLGLPGKVQQLRSRLAACEAEAEPEPEL